MSTGLFKKSSVRCELHSPKQNWRERHARHLPSLCPMKWSTPNEGQNYREERDEKCHRETNVVVDARAPNNRHLVHHMTSLSCPVTSSREFWQIQTFFHIWKWIFWSNTSTSRMSGMQHLLSTRFFQINYQSLRINNRHVKVITPLPRVRTLFQTETSFPCFFLHSDSVGTCDN